MKTKMKIRIYAFTLFAAMVIVVSSCKKDDEPEVPTLTTSEVTEITSSNAISGGTITDNGGAAVTVRGVCWSTSPNPTTDDNKTEDGAGSGNFTSNITGLQPDTKYYVRAYATNSAGTAYGNQLEFTTALGIGLPVVTTEAVTEIDRHTAVSGGEVISDGGGEITARGVCWSTSPDPTIDDEKTEDGDGLGSFVSNISNLLSDTRYYLRAYATNEAGTGYGDELEFTTLQEGIVADIDGNIYQTVMIGNQEWMAENLRVKTYNNGDPISGPLQDDDWANAGANGQAVYGIFKLGRPGTDGIETTAQMVDFYGKLYNWYVVETENICPAGWRVPGSEDWDELANFVVSQGVDTFLVSNELKICRQIDSPLPGCAVSGVEDHPLWRADDEHIAKDTYGLGLVPSGFIHNTSGNSSWMTSRGYWWTADQTLDDLGNPTTSARYRRIYFDHGELERLSTSKSIGLAIRCIKK